MPRKGKGPRLYLRAGRNAGWVIRDGPIERRTGCRPDDRESAEKALAEYIVGKYEPPKRETDLGRISCADVLNIYLQEQAANTRSLEFIIYTAASCIKWWGDKTLSDVRAANCRHYVEWRCAQNVSQATARHDLKTLRAAINYYHANYGPLQAVPVITLPPRSPPKTRWLTREEAARLLMCARAHHHTARFILIGLYTGTRSQAILQLRWFPSIDAGWFDLDRGVLYRRGVGEVETAKRRPPIPISKRLLPHLHRWRQADLANGIAHVIHWRGQPIQKMRRSWAQARTMAGLPQDVTPHTLRHTATTWLLQANVPMWEVAGFVGMSEETIRNVYGHHAPEHLRRAANAPRNTQK